eukprot:GFUD01013023.1.p1 GENE.GFUD01013023.1~~GFUD01013023.1.p1  ORF type:complete len:332 (-),score=89.36 GFUD01013023.1:174-1142(-)
MTENIKNENTSLSQAGESVLSNGLQGGKRKLRKSVSNDKKRESNEVVFRVQNNRTREEFSNMRSVSESNLNKIAIINLDLKNIRKLMIKEVLSKAISIQKGAREHLQKLGLLKSKPVFGSTIPEITKTDGTKIPKFLTKCTNLIAKNPKYMKTEGLYRRNGNMATIQSLRFEVDQGRLIKLDLEKNVHILTGLIKLFFRELSSPLIPWTTIEKLADAYDKISKTDDKKKRGKELRTVGQIISTLHPANRDTLFFLLEHLYAVSGFSDVNQMNNENLAMMLGPTLSWTEDLTNMTTMASMMIKQNNVVGYLISDCHQLKVFNK